MPAPIHCYFDFVCPYAYLGSTQIEAIAAEATTTVLWKPILLGGLFRQLGVPADLAHSLPQVKQDHNALDLSRWAGHFDVPLVFPTDHPRSSVLALRALLSVPETQLSAAVHALYRAYWVEGIDLRVPSEVAAVLDRAVLDRAVLDGAVLDRAGLDRAGLDGTRCVEEASSEQIKAALWERTREAFDRGVFGAPTFFVGDEMFWGQDRLEFVRRALG